MTISDKQTEWNAPIRSDIASFASWLTQNFQGWVNFDLDVYVNPVKFFRATEHGFRAIFNGGKNDSHIKMPFAIVDAANLRRGWIVVKISTGSLLVPEDGARWFAHSLVEELAAAFTDAETVVALDGKQTFASKSALGFKLPFEK